MQNLSQILGNTIGNINKLIDKTIDNNISLLRNENFNIDIEIPKDLADLLKYKSINNIKLKELLLDIQKILNTLWNSIISDETIKNRKNLADNARSTAEREFYEGSYDGPTTNCDESSDADPHQSFLDDFCNKFCFVTRNLVM